MRSNTCFPLKFRLGFENHINIHLYLCGCELLVAIRVLKFSNLLKNTLILTEITPVSLSGDIVADVGCGYGWFAKKLAVLHPKCKIYALETDSKCIALGRGGGNENIYWGCINGSFAENIIEEKLDSIFLIGVVNELSEIQIRKLMSDVKEKLKADGQAYVSFIVRDLDYFDFVALLYARYVSPKAVQRHHIETVPFISECL